MEYAFQVALETSRNLFRSKSVWSPTAYEGTFRVDAATLDLLHLTILARDLPAETGVCETEANLEDEHRSVGGEDFLIPRESRMRFVQRDASEAENVMTFAGCEANLPVAEPPKQNLAEPLPPRLVVPLAFESEIDSDQAAAGDPISIRAIKSILEPGVITTTTAAGYVAHGRIVLFEHDIAEKRFVLGIALETLGTTGIVRPFYATVLERHSNSSAVLAHGGAGVSNRKAARRGPGRLRVAVDHVEPALVRCPSHNVTHSDSSDNQETESGWR